MQSQIVARLKQKGSKNSKTVGSVIPLLGSLAGNYLGGPAGGAVGLAAGKLISSITGFGDYKVNKNSVIQSNSVPTFRSGGDGMKIAHREFITDILGGPDFLLHSYSLNPGLANTFPWLSSIAQNFEEYEMNGLVFEYRPSSGSAVSSTSSALGIVIMATDYDSANPSFPDKQTMESYEFSSSTVPFTGCMHPVECARGRNVLNNLYTRTGLIPPNTDIRMYDVGNFQIASEGMQSAYTLGELWVTYDVTFRKPRLPFSTSTIGNFLHLVESPSLSLDSVYSFGATGAIALPSSNMVLGVDWLPHGTNGVIIMRPGVYFITYIAFNTTTSTNVSVPSGANITVIPNRFHEQASSYVNISQFENDTFELQDTRTIVVSAPGGSTTNYIDFQLNGFGIRSGSCDCIFSLISRNPSTMRALLREAAAFNAKPLSGTIVSSTSDEKFEVVQRPATTQTQLLRR